MGNPSSLRFIPASGSTTPINWARVPEASKKALTQTYGYDWERDVLKPLPETVADVAKMFDETKFFGYFESDILTALMDISEFGLQVATPTGRSIAQVGPRFYMNYFDKVWFFLFAPGKRDCIVGYSDYIIRKTELDDDRDMYTKMAADKSHETAMAKEFDVTAVCKNDGTHRVADVAKMFDETKFFGYFESDILTALMDISEFGLQVATPTGRSIAQVGPYDGLPHLHWQSQVGNLRLVSRRRYMTIPILFDFTQMTIPSPHAMYHFFLFPRKM
jgi:hypothetical protein